MKSINFETSENPSFIGGWFIDKNVCDELVSFYKETNYFPTFLGRTAGTVNLEVKKSIDKTVSTFTQDLRVLSYLDQLSKVVDLYKKEYVWCNSTSFEWNICNHFNIQCYPPGGGYPVFHFERDGNIKDVSRFLAFMTYLNDISDAGETEFYYQKIKIKPQKGLTLIWPAEWTHTHRGVPSPSQEKIITTGWYSFV